MEHWLCIISTIITTVTLTPTAPTPRARSTARAIRGTRGKGWCVLVSYDVSIHEPRFVFVKFEIIWNLKVHFNFFIFLDIDECTPKTIPTKYKHLAHNCHSDANCTNNKGTFYCTCHTGYSGDGVACEGKSGTILSFVRLTFELWARLYDIAHTDSFMEKLWNLN